MIKSVTPAVPAPLWTKDFSLLAAGNLLLGIAFYFLIPILPLFFKDSLHLPMRAIGLLMALFTISALAIRPFTGFWLDRFDRRALFIGAFIGMVALFALYPLASGVAAMALLRLAHGGAWGMTTTASSTIIADIVPAQRRGEGLGYFGLSMTLAMSLGPLIGIAIVKRFDYATLFFAGCAIGCTGLIVALFASYPRHAAQQRRFLWSGLIEPATVPVSLVQLVLNVTYGGLLSYVLMYGKQIGIANPGNFFLFLAIGLALSRMWSGRVFDRRGPVLLLRTGFGVLVVGFVVLAGAKSSIVYLLAAFCIGTGNGIIMPSFQAMINAVVVPQRRGAANSTYYTGFDIGVGGGMVLIGYCADALGLRVSFLVCGGIGLCALLLFETIARKHYARNVKPGVVIGD
jgi:predicted MFS family arabinose efflux permease